MLFRLLSFNLGKEIKKQCYRQKYQGQSNKGSAGDGIKINHKSFANFLILTANPLNTIAEIKYAVKSSGLFTLRATSNVPAERSAQIEEMTSKKLGSFIKARRININTSIERNL